jgi:kinesin family protein 3/17
MTGSGKTHTIAGSASSPGIVPRAVHHIFSNLRNELASNRENVAMVFLTYIELYNNILYDLLGYDLPDDNDSGALKLREHPTKGVYITGSSTIKTPVSSPEEALSLISRGTKLRATSATNLNERSSRSHTVIIMEVVSQEITSGTAKIGKINLVDLAGSERVRYAY